MTTRDLLSVELRRLVRFRWVAIAAIAVGAAGNALGWGWSPVHARVLALAGVIAIYNGLAEVLRRRAATASQRRAQAWWQLAADLASLTLLVLWTGGAASPVLLAYLLLMVLAGLLLRPVEAYLGAAAAIGLVFGGLWTTGGWPDERRELVMLLGWTLTLLLVVYLTNHIARGLRGRETQLMRQARRTQAILETAAEGIITIDGRGTIDSVNPAAERIFGYGSAEVVGRNVSLLMPEPYRTEHDGYIASYLRTGEARIIGIGREVMGRHKDGRAFPIDLAVSEVTGGDTRLFTGIVRDISQRKETETELKALNESLLRHQESLVQHEKMAAMGRLAAGLAHEIANPLASMDGLLQLAQRHPDRLAPDAIETLRAQILRIDRLVRQMKSFARPADAAWETVDLNTLVTQAIEMIRFDQRAQRVTIDRALAPDAGEVRVTPQAIEQVIANLIVNALDAVADADDPRIEVATGVRPDAAVITIRDNGKGISPEHLGRVFEPFFTTKPVGQGTGLGLSTSYSLVERNNGAIEVTSTPGRGATFVITLPRPSREREPGDTAHSHT